MLNNYKDLYENLKQAVVNMEEERVIELCKYGLEQGAPPLELINKGLTEGMRVVGDLFEKNKLVLPHMIIGADIMQKGLEILEPEIKKGAEVPEYKGKVVIGTVEGDIHDIGKGIVSVILSSNGYKVKDLGSDVPNDDFLKEVRTGEYDFLCMSALMTTTIINQEKVIQGMKNEGLREKVYVVVGGSAVTSDYAEKIGTDVYGETPQEAIVEMDKLIAKKKG